MIEINLLPDELKAKPREKRAGFDTKKEYLLYAPFIILGIFLLIHIYLAIAAISKNAQLHMLNNKWAKIEPERKELENFNRQYSLESSDAANIKNLTEQRINWAEKLNKLSLHLPSGVWFNEISITAKDFTLRGSAVSLQKEEMGSIKAFTDKLKNDPGFFRDFTNLELSSVQRKVLGGYDILDFVLVGTFKG